MRNQQTPHRWGFCLVDYNTVNTTRSRDASEAVRNSCLHIFLLESPLFRRREASEEPLPSTQGSRAPHKSITSPGTLSPSPYSYSSSIPAPAPQMLSCSSTRAAASAASRQEERVFMVPRAQEHGNSQQQQQHQQHRAPPSVQRPATTPAGLIPSPIVSSCVNPDDRQAVTLRQHAAQHRVHPQQQRHRHLQHAPESQARASPNTMAHRAPTPYQPLSPPSFAAAAGQSFSPQSALSFALSPSPAVTPSAAAPVVNGVCVCARARACV